MNANLQASTIESALPIPRDLQGGDIVRIRGTKDVGRIIEENYLAYEVCVFGDTNRYEQFAFERLEMWTPAPRRQFKSDEVRIIGTRFNGRIAYICEDFGNEEEDRPYGAFLYGEKFE